MSNPPNIAKNLKFERDKLGWSLSKAAVETGVSKAMLGQIERGVSSPTIATLWKIVGGFHIPMSRLIDDGSLTQEFKREAHQRPIRFENSIGFKTLFPFDERLGNEMYEMTLAPNESHTSRAHDLGVIEDIVVIQGEMEILIEAVWQSFKKGDAVRFRADQDHGYRNLSDQECRFHNIIHYPT